MMVSHACAEFLVHCRVAKNLSPHSLRAYTLDLLEFQRFVGSDTIIHAIDRHVLRRYLIHLFEARTLKETSVKRRIACLKVMFRWLELDEVIEINPFHRMDARIRLPQRLPRNLTREEVRQLRAATLARVGLSGRITATKAVRACRKPHTDAITALVAIEVLLATGMRVGELAAVRRADIDLDDGVIRVNGKGSRQRRVFLPDPETVVLVQAYLSVVHGRCSGAPTFLVTATGAPASTHIIRQLVRAAAEDAALSRRVTPHMLRHTAATMLLESGLDLRFVQRLLGHRSISTTEGYTTVSDRSLRAALQEAAGRMKEGARTR